MSEQEWGVGWGSRLSPNLSYMDTCESLNDAKQLLEKLTKLGYRSQLLMRIKNPQEYEPFAPYVEPGPQTNAEMVTEFHKAFGLPINTRPTMVSLKLQRLRTDLLCEETLEFAKASRQQNIVEIAKELADVLYVTYGAALTYGIDLDAVMKEVHRSNMSKLDKKGKPVLRDDGKVLKSEQYRMPNVALVLWPEQLLPGDE